MLKSPPEIENAGTIFWWDLYALENNDFSLCAFFLEMWASQKKVKRTILSELKAVHLSDAVEKYTREVLHDT
jgi:hypothetical protein